VRQRWPCAKVSPAKPSPLPWATPASASPPVTTPTPPSFTQVEAVLSALTTTTSGSLDSVDPASNIARLAETLRSQLAPPLLDALITQLRDPAKP
jgi:hypothetical protein